MLTRIVECIIVSGSILFLFYLCIFGQPPARTVERIRRKRLQRKRERSVEE